ncbi:Asp-tRNA(Asn)/Glu-tRNA(Gln) amidotransferase subunit GatB [Gammaproteobacteria bacterium]|nr:Asp-tRNA(Asn)/Glu-tRNA(Gln) amidotransferase subunit GatB [Gammaproteobacteria bacterium]
MQLKGKEVLVTAGLEVHIQLNTKTKAFSGSKVGFGDTPNQNTSQVDIGMPGSLPVVNKEMVRQAILLGDCLNSKINQIIKFTRKHYFYPDLPKGYQITQDDHPILLGGFLEYYLNGELKRCEIHHAHLEEDAGKSLHGYRYGQTGIDLNRAGQPLLEIVTEPCLNGIDEIIGFLKQLHSLVTYLGICDGNMQEGSFRCDVNVSIRTSKDEPLGTRVELKNMNSFKFIQKALQYEINRQIDCLDSGQPVVQETRLYNEKRQTTESMRKKEDADDYRYFQDPDIPAIWVNDQFIEDAKSAVPEKPEDRINRYVKSGLQAVDARIIAYNKPMAEFLDQVTTDGHAPQPAANWILGVISALANKDQLEFSQIPFTPVQLSEIMNKVASQSLSSKMAKDVIEYVWKEQLSVADIISKYNLKQLSSDDDLKAIIQTVIDQNPTQLEQYKNGKDKLFGFFVGQSMKASKGQANPERLNQLLKEML